MPVSSVSGRTTRRCGRHVLLEVEESDPRRSEVESFVRRVFSRVHRADVRTFMPTLLALQGLRRGVCGVAGIRCASTARLYLESYLPAPVEEVLEQRLGRVVRREEIAEVGNLAGTSCRAACHLVTLLPRYLLEREQRWVVFTATHAVRTLLARYEAPVFELAVADPKCVATAGDSWGRYYDADPRVMAGYLPHGLRLPTFALATV